MITDTDLIIMYAENEKFRKEKPLYRFRMPLDKRFEEYFKQIYGNDVTVNLIDKNGVRNAINARVEHAFISGVFLHDKDHCKSSYFSYSTITSIRNKHPKTKNMNELTNKELENMLKEEFNKQFPGMKIKALAIGITIAALALCSCGKRTVCRCIDTDTNYTVLTDITECPTINSCDELSIADTTLFDCREQ